MNAEKREEAMLMNKEASRDGKASFKLDINNKEYTVRSSYGTLKAGMCCGSGCFGCVYGGIKMSTTPIQNLDW